jgi:uncharacterized membrane protein YccC
MAEAVPLHPLLGRLARLGHVSPEAGFAIRFAVAVVLSLFIGQLPGLVTNSPSWILITVITVAQPLSGSDGSPRTRPGSSPASS